MLEHGAIDALIPLIDHIAELAKKAKAQYSEPDIALAYELLLKRLEEVKLLATEIVRVSQEGEADG